MSTITFWYEFASTYSYLTAMRIERACRSSGVELAWQPFLLGPIFKAQGWDTSPFEIYAAKGRYMWRDLERRAARQGLPPIRRPESFPQNGLLAARVATIGAKLPWGPAFTRAVYTAQFADGATISEPDLLISLLDGLGVEGAQILSRAQTDNSIKTELRVATETAQSIGIFGAPSFVFGDDELFWGDDRLEDAISWAAGVQT